MKGGEAIFLGSNTGNRKDDFAAGMSCTIIDVSAC